MSLVPVPAHAIVDLLVAAAVGQLNAISQRPHPESSVMLYVTAQLFWDGTTISTAFPITGGTPLYVLKGTDIEFYLLPVKNTPGMDTKSVSLFCPKNGWKSESSGNRVVIRTGSFRAITDDGLRKGPQPSEIYPISILGSYTNGREHCGFFNLEHRDRISSQQATFNLIVLDHDAVIKALENSEIVKAAGYMGGPTISPAIPILPGSGPRYPLTDVIAQEFLINTPGTTPAGFNPVGATPMQYAGPVEQPAQPEARPEPAYAPEPEAEYQPERDYRAEADSRRERAERTEASRRQQERDDKAQAQQERDERAEADRCQRERDDKARRAEAERVRRAEADRLDAEAQQADSQQHPTRSAALTDWTERSMVETYETNLSGRTFDLSGPVYYRSVCDQYPQHALVVVYDRAGRVVQGVRLEIFLEGYEGWNAIQELNPGGVVNPGWPVVASGFRLKVNGTLVANVKTRGAGSSVWIPVLCDNGRYSIGGQACPATIE